MQWPVDAASHFLKLVLSTMLVCMLCVLYVCVSVCVCVYVRVCVRAREPGLEATVVGIIVALAMFHATDTITV